MKQKEVILKRIELQKFRSVTSEIAFNSGETDIVGRNGIGKTAQLSAWLWLLTGYTDSHSPKNFNLYDNRYELSKDTPAASVKATLDIDGVEYTIERRAKAGFSRVRGSDEWVKSSSDKYTLLIDGIETAPKNFDEWVEGMFCQSEMLPFCLDGSFFVELCESDKKSARKILSAVIGDIEVESDDFSEIVGLMKKYTIEQIVERAKNENKDLTAKKNKAEIEIDALRRCISGEEIDESKANESIRQKRAEISQYVKKTIRTTDDELTEITKAISKAREDYDRRNNDEVMKLINEMNLIESRNSERKISNRTGAESLAAARRNLEANTKLLKRLQLVKNDYLVKAKEIKRRVFAEDKCAYCGQELPLDMLQKLKEDFMNAKAADLEVVKANGEDIARRIKEISSEIRKLEKITAKGFTEEPLESTAEIKKKIENFKDSIKPFEDTDIYCRFLARRNEIEKSMTVDAEEDLQKQIDKLTSEISEIESALSKAKEDKEHSERIEYLKDVMKNAAVHIAKNEGIIMQCADYSERYAKAVSEAVNGKMRNCRISMFETLKNGQRNPTCTITDNDGVRYATTNQSKRIKMNIEIQEMFMSHFGLRFPVWVDEFSVFDSKNKPSVDGQMITLSASDDKFIKVLQ